MVWMTDTSAEAAKRRAAEQLTAATAAMVTIGNTEAEEEAARRKAEREAKKAAEEEARKKVRPAGEGGETAEMRAAEAPERWGCGVAGGGCGGWAAEALAAGRGVARPQAEEEKRAAEEEAARAAAEATAALLASGDPVLRVRALLSEKEPGAVVKEIKELTVEGGVAGARGGMLGGGPLGSQAFALAPEPSLSRT